MDYQGEQHKIDEQKKLMIKAMKKVKLDMEKVAEDRAALVKAKDEHVAKMRAERAELEQQLRQADDEADRLQDQREALAKERGQAVGVAPTILTATAGGEGAAAMQKALDAAKADLEDYKVTREPVSLRVRVCVRRGGGVGPAVLCLLRGAMIMTTVAHPGADVRLCGNFTDRGRGQAEERREGQGGCVGGENKGTC